MFKILVVFLILLFYSFAISVVEYENDNENLIAVALTYRHGARSPIFSFPTDEYFNLTYWPMGFGQLTKFGIISQYELGQWFRQRYKNFLSEIYSDNEIYIYSTDTDRSLMSAYANLAGLYPPKDFQKWNDQIPWQPIPVYTANRMKDDILVAKRVCNKYDILYKNVKRRIEEEFNEKYAKFLRYIQDHSGWPIVTIQEAKTLRSVLNTYSSYNRSFIPEWTKSIDQSTLDYLTAVVYKLATYTPILARLQIGPFFAYLFDYFDSFVQPSNENVRPKFLMISGHDTTTASILNAMGAYYKMMPINFTDSVIWELRKKDTNTYFINLFYKSCSKLESLTIYNCDFNCDYTDFKNSMVNITTAVDDWLEECNV